MLHLVKSPKINDPKAIYFMLMLLDAPLEWLPRPLRGVCQFAVLYSREVTVMCPKWKQNLDERDVPQHPRGKKTKILTYLSKLLLYHKLP